MSITGDIESFKHVKCDYDKLADSLLEILTGIGLDTSKEDILAVMSQEVNTLPQSLTAFGALFEGSDSDKVKGLSFKFLKTPLVPFTEITMNSGFDLSGINNLFNLNDANNALAKAIPSININLTGDIESFKHVKCDYDKLADSLLEILTGIGLVTSKEDILAVMSQEVNTLPQSLTAFGALFEGSESDKVKGLSFKFLKTPLVAFTEIGMNGGFDLLGINNLFNLNDANNALAKAVPSIPASTDNNLPVLNLIYRQETGTKETMTVQPGAGFPDNHYLQTGHLVMNDKGEGVTRQHYKFYPTALPSDSSTWGEALDDTPFDASVNIHPTLAGTDANDNPIPSVAGHNDDYNDKTPLAGVYNNWDIWNKYNSLAEQKMFTDVDLLPDDSVVNIVNPESNKIHFCVTSYLMETNDVFVDPTNTQDTTEANLKASRFAVGDAKAFARTAFELDSARPYTVFSRELFDNNGDPISAIPLNDANVDHELTVIPVLPNVDKYNIGMAGDSVSYKIQPGEGEGRLQIIQDMNLGQGQYTHSSSFAFAGEKKIYRFNNSEEIGLTTPLTLSLCHDRTNVSVNVKLNGEDVTNSDSCVNGKFIQNITFPTNQVSDIEITTVDPTQTGDYTMTLIETVDNIPETNVAFGETQLFTLDASQTWTESMILEVNDGLHKWESIITATPTGTKISPTFSLQPLGTTNNNEGFSRSLVNINNTEPITTNTSGNYANYQITKGAVVLNSASYIDDWNDTDNTATQSVKDHAIIQLGHILGIGSLWNKDVTIDGNNIVNDDLIDRGTNNDGFPVVTDGVDLSVNLYKGAHALNVYKYVGQVNDDTNNPGATLQIDGVETNYKNSNTDTNEQAFINSYIGLPIQRDPNNLIIDNLTVQEGASGEGTEIKIDDGSVSGIKTYIGLGREYMSSLNEAPNINMKLSAISAGFLEDLGYQVDYANCDSFNMETEGDSTFN